MLSVGGFIDSIVSFNKKKEKEERACIICVLSMILTPIHPEEGGLVDSTQHVSP